MSDTTTKRAADLQPGDHFLYFGAALTVAQVQPDDDDGVAIRLTTGTGIRTNADQKYTLIPRIDDRMRGIARGITPGLMDTAARALRDDLRQALSGRGLTDSEVLAVKAYMWRLACGATIKIDLPEDSDV